MLQLGFLVQKEQEREAQERATSGDRRDQYQRKKGRKARARQQFAETGSVG